MVKKKSLTEKADVEEKVNDTVLEEDDEIIELEEVVEEPEELPVGEDLDKLLFEEGDKENDDVDLESIDATLGLGEAEEAEELEEENDKEIISPTQEDIDALLEDQSFMEKIEQETVPPVTPDKEEEPVVDVDRLVSELEERILSRIEEFFEKKLPELVLKTVREELENLKREFEENT